jgi:hypothetical protein
VEISESALLMIWLPYSRKLLGLEKDSARGGRFKEVLGRCGLKLREGEDEQWEARGEDEGREGKEEVKTGWGRI